MRSYTFKVDCKPPYKQGPADKTEKEQQALRRGQLQEAARSTITSQIIFSGPCSLSIKYSRATGKCDSANVIGGVADSLQGTLYINDNQIKEVSYCEWKGGNEWYQVTVTEIEPLGI